MSGIFGFINLDGRPVAPEHFEAMADEMAKWGPDGVGKICSENAAFGHALLIVTHESRFEKMPYYDANEGIIFTSAARLDNRDELCDLFSIAHPERPTTSDGQLVLQAYRKWGAESCKHLFGDWSFALWHIKEKRLFLARDHLGNTGLYYYFKPPLIVFASNTKGVLAHPQVLRMLDELYLAQRLVFDYSEKNWSRTYWKDVCYLPAAHAMIIAHANTHVANYWRLEEAPHVRLESDSAYVEGFLEQYRRAVRVRLNTIRPVGSTLSAGLDSSSVTALAAEALQKNNQPLVAYTSIPLYPSEKLFPNSLTDEWPLAHQVAQSYDNIEHIPIRADNMTALEAIRQSLNVTHEPQHAVANMNWIISIFENARRRNLGVMLTGQLGNGGVSWSGGTNYIFHLFVGNQWHKGLIALQAWKDFQGFSWLRTLKSQLLRPVLWPLWSKYQLFIDYIKQKDLSYSFAREDFVRRMGLKKVTMTELQLKYFDPLTELLLTTIRNGTMAGTVWPSIGYFYRMEVRDPTADVRLLEYCMGVPDEQHTFAGGQRMLVRRAMSGILPDTVRWNTIRGKQAADAGFRLLDQQVEIDKELIRLTSAFEATQYLDVLAMKRAWKTIQSHSAHPMAVGSLLRSISNAFFLLSFSEYQHQTSATRELNILNNS